MKHRRFRNSDQVDIAPLMLRGSSEFEEKRIVCDFELVFKQVSEIEWHGFKDPMEFVYRKAYVAGKAAGLRAGGSDERISGETGE